MLSARLFIVKDERFMCESRFHKLQSGRGLLTNFLSKNTFTFSEKDLGRMPEGFRAEIARAAKEKGGSLTVSGETRRMEGGFVLVYGGVEENCSFRALFDSRKDELQDKVNRLLFF